MEPRGWDIVISLFTSGKDAFIQKSHPLKKKEFRLEFAIATVREKWRNGILSIESPHGSKAL